MNTRHLIEQDLPAVKRLWDSCFEKEEEPFFQWFFSRRYQPGNALGIFQDEILLAALHIAPYTIRLRGMPIPAGYLMGVGTFPEYRRQGCMTELLKAALADMRTRGMPVSVLLPRRPGIYTRHGWDICYYTHRYRVPAKTLRTAAGGRLRPAGMCDIAALDAVYRRFMQPYHAYVLRGVRHWQELLTENESEQGMLHLLETDGAVDGYIMFKAVEDTLFIKEMAYLDAQSRRILLSFAASHVKAEDSVVWDLPVSDPAYRELADERQAVTLYPHSSGRIVDIVQAAHSCRLPGSINGKAAIAIRDPLAAWNQGTFKLTAEQGKLTITGGQKPEIAMSIGAFSRLFFGVGIDDLLALGEADVYREEAIPFIRQLFPRETNSIYENF